MNKWFSVWIVFLVNICILSLPLIAEDKCPEHFNSIIKYFQKNNSEPLESATALRKIINEKSKNKDCVKIQFEAMLELNKLKASLLQKYYPEISSTEMEDQFKKNGFYPPYGELLSGDKVITALILENKFLSVPSLLYSWILYRFGIKGVGERYNPLLLEHYQEMAKEGNPRFQYYLGLIYRDGLGISKNHEIAEKWLKLSGLGESKTQLGLLYLEEKNDIITAEKYWLEAYEEDSEAAYHLGVSYRDQKRYADALKFFHIRLKDKPDDTYTLVNLGQMNLEGWGVSNCEDGKKYFHQAADKLNDSVAQYALGNYYLNPMGEKLKCFKKSLDKAYGYLKSSTTLGNKNAEKLFLETCDTYKNISPDDPDRKIVIKYCKFKDNTSIDLNKSKGMDNCKKISSYAKEGQKNYKKKNYKKAIEAYKQQVLLSKECKLSESEMGVAYNNVALAYLKNSDPLTASAYIALAPESKQSKFNQSLIEAFNERRIKKSSEINNPKNIPNGGNDSFDALKIKAEAGDLESQFILGAMYLGDVGVEKDLKLANYWFEKAARRGHSKAQVEFGSSFLFGEGVQQDYKQAKEWFEKAAKQGNDEAELSLGGLYLKGFGVPQNNELARKWFEKSLKHGNVHVQSILDGMASKEQ
jgi:TPR repeat protein